MIVSASTPGYQLWSDDFSEYYAQNDIWVKDKVNVNYEILQGNIRQDTPVGWCKKVTGEYVFRIGLTVNAMPSNTKILVFPFECQFNQVYTAYMSDGSSLNLNVETINGVTEVMTLEESPNDTLVIHNLELIPKNIKL